MSVEEQFQPFLAKCKEQNMSDAAISAFKHNFEQLAAGATGMMPESEIEAVETLPKLADMQDPEQYVAKKLLSATAMLKLNGGLGTSMGLEKAKSLLVVKDGKTFLDLIAEQVKHMRATYGSKVPFVLMNSFSTSDDTKHFLAKAHSDLLEEPHIELLQNKSPKVDAATLRPASCPDAPDLEWCPPGHGDIYPALLGSGLLDALLGEGIKYLFVSNSDNLGATLNLTLLSHFANSGQAFLMEVCERTAADKKGGHLCRRTKDGILMLRESAMCPDSDKAAFEDVSKHKFFNTNNLWLNLDALKQKLEEAGGVLPLPLIKNKKTVNPRDPSSTPVFQLETAMGSAIECFGNSGAVVVPRARFAPVKTCGDLLVLRSDCYEIAEDATVSARVTDLPLVKLDDKHYKLVDGLEALIPPGCEPSLVGATTLTVKGPVKFEKGVVVKGDCTIEAPAGEPLEVKAGEVTGTVTLEAPKKKEEEKEEKKEEEEKAEEKVAA